MTAAAGRNERVWEWKRESQRGNDYVRGVWEVRETAIWFQEEKEQIANYLSGASVHSHHLAH